MSITPYSSMINAIFNSINSSPPDDAGISFGHRRALAEGREDAEGNVISDLFAISAPNVNPPNSISLAGAIYIYKKNSIGEWDLTHTVYGERDNENIGAIDLQFYQTEAKTQTHLYVTSADDKRKILTVVPKDVSDKSIPVPFLFSYLKDLMIFELWHTFPEKERMS